jgi:cell wall-associated NlpC family hydrolase
MKVVVFLFFMILYISCSQEKSRNQSNTSMANEISTKDSSTDDFMINDTFFDRDTATPIKNYSQPIVDYAKTLIGVPYLYASTDPSKGLDCSGFITAVYHHFNIDVPRSSVDFTNYGTTILISETKIGDLILFTGTDSAQRVVGHMGIITQTQDSLKFIHSTSGKAYGVTITPLNKYYQGRFVKIIRIND